MVDVLNATNASALSSIAETTADTTAATSAQQTLTGDFQNFLTLLTTQLQNQDPLSPLDTNEFTNQLVLFAGVEQQIATNTNLNKLVTSTDGNTLSQSTGFIDQFVEIAGSNFNHDGTDNEISYTLPADITSTSINIVNSAGQTVRTLTGEVTAGTHNIIWDGQDGAGTILPNGTYSLNIIANNNSNEAVTEGISTRIIDKVTAVQSNTTNGTQLKLGDITVNLSDVLSIRTPAALTTTNTTAQSQNLSLGTSLLGNNIIAAATSINFNHATSTDTLAFNLPENAIRGDALIFDNANQLVRTLPLESVTAGASSISWDGKDESGTDLALGEYSFRVVARNANGTTINGGLTQVQGLVDSVEQANNITRLNVGNLKINLPEVITVTKPS